ncbi:hypothetical protein KO566_01620 [Flavobacteriaceae bacterium XHP0103]|uniref:hypothetical protein n=1 Tax=Marixanthotalea marina TaxID=2844359 RepID=UPI00298A07C8|nr:hypothetical protein [Marixanthotalea marina]MBU3820745.1 hypothetical protein [Marixanthotalea marina]
MKRFLSILLVIFCFITIYNCDNGTISDKEKDQQELIDLQKSIEDLIATSVCNENTECKFIGFGSKSCGGYKSYLIYSNSINVSELEDMVETYNNKESAFNNKYRIISDCTMVMPPSSVICENNTCVAVY